MAIQTASNSQAVLLMASWLTIKYPNYQKLEKLFLSIIVYDGSYRACHTKQETDIYFKQKLPKISSFDEIYVWGAQHSFGFFVVENNIPFIFCEEATGMHSRCKIVEHIDEKNPKLKDIYSYAYNLGLYSGNCASTKTILCNFAAQLKGTQTEGFIDFRVVDCLMNLPLAKQQQIIQFFIAPKSLHILADSTIIFTQHLANLRLTTFEEQALIYQMLVDYFFENCPLVIKPHPDDVMYYAKLFPEAQIIRERFPSEFLPFLVDNEPECVATIYSTAIYNLRGHYPEVFELDDRYERDFPKTHRYYMALQIAKILGEPIYCIGTNEILIEKLANRVGVSLEHCCEEFHEDTFPEAPYTVIVDDIAAQGDMGRSGLQKALFNAGENTVFIFTNTKSDYCWYALEQKNLWENILPVLLMKTLRDDAPEEDFYENLEEEMMYVYTKKTELRKEVNEISMEKHLPHVGIDVSKLPLTDEKEHIKMLEGILAATEQRLLYYINRVKELERK